MAATPPREWTPAHRSNTNGKERETASLSSEPQMTKTTSPTKKRKISHSRNAATADPDDLFDCVFPTAVLATSSESRSIPPTTQRADIPVASTSQLPPKPPAKRPALTSTSRVVNPPRRASTASDEPLPRVKTTTKPATETEKSRHTAKVLKKRQKRRDEAEVRLHANNLNIALKSAYRRRSNYELSSNSNDHTDEDSGAAPDSSIINDVFWTAREKSLFFHSLSRHSKLRLDLVAVDIPSKTYLDVLAYVAYLEDISEKASVSRGGLRKHEVSRSKYESSFAGLPSAREVSEGWIRREEKLGERLENYAIKARRVNQLLPTVISELNEAHQDGRPRITEEEEESTPRVGKIKLRLTNLENILGHLTPVLLSGLEFIRPRVSREEALAFEEEYARNPEAALPSIQVPSHPPPASDYSTPLLPIVNPFSKESTSSHSTARLADIPASTVDPTAATSTRTDEPLPRIEEEEDEMDEESEPPQNVVSRQRPDPSPVATSEASRQNSIRESPEMEEEEEDGTAEPSEGKSITKGGESSTKQRATKQIGVLGSKSIFSSATDPKSLANSKLRDWRRFRISKNRLALYEPLGEELGKTVCALEDMAMGPGLLGGAAEFFNLATLGNLVGKGQGSDGWIQGDVVGVLCRHLKNHVDKIITAAVKLRAAGRVLDEEASDENSLATPYILAALDQLSLPATLPTGKRTYTMDPTDELSIERKSAQKRQKTESRSQEQSRSSSWSVRIVRLDPIALPVIEDGAGEGVGGLERLFEHRRSDDLLASTQMGPRAFPPPAPLSLQASAAQESGEESTIEFEGNEPSDLALMEFQGMEDNEAMELDEQLDRDAEQEWIEEFGDVSEMDSDSDLEMEEGEAVDGDVEEAEEDEGEVTGEGDITGPASPRAEEDDVEEAEALDAPAANYIDPLSLPMSWRRVSSNRPILKGKRKKQKKPFVPKTSRSYVRRKPSTVESKSLEFITLSDDDD